ncbi:group I truncated hemoglobin [Nocardioides guangzhouensis]|uniref:group I truncated hemoglobin n=1 Tax=Nocardioides guangzhouensis TaxID=2497878 RepID=UPI0014385C20|nr:group 1 truncated hemoglobin [Nocardioides guangzhouensis]
MSAASFSSAASDYEKIGGGPAVKAVVDRFYELILADDQLVGFFEGADLTSLKRHQVLLISQVLGGPASYDGRDLREAHAGLDITRVDYLKVVSLLVQALVEAGVPPAVIERVGEALASTERDVVTSPAG